MIVTLLDTLIKQPVSRLINDCAWIPILNLISLTFQADMKPPNKQFLSLNFSFYSVVKTFCAFTFHCITLSTKFIGEIFPKYNINNRTTTPVTCNDKLAQFK